MGEGGFAGFGRGDAAGCVLALLAAPAIGSFLGVLVERLPQGRDVLWSRSCCDDCHTVLGPRDLVPLASAALSRGRCRHCGAGLDPFVWRIELAAIVVMAAALLAGPDWPTRIANAVLLELLLALAWCDLRWWRLPDGLTLPLLLAGLAEALWQSGGAVADPVVTDRAIGAVAGWGLLAAIGWIYRRLRGRDGLGGGDAKLLAAGGAWLGWAALGPVLLVASVATLGAAAGAWAATRRGAVWRASTALPFGPGLAAGIALLRVWLSAAS